MSRCNQSIQVDRRSISNTNATGRISLRNQADNAVGGDNEESMLAKDAVDDD